MKVLNKKQYATLKKIAKTNYPLVAKRQALQDKMKNLQESIDELDAQIEVFESGAKLLTGGLMSVQLFDRVETQTEGQRKSVDFVPKRELIVETQDGGAQINVAQETKLFNEEA